MIGGALRQIEVLARSVEADKIAREARDPVACVSELGFYIACCGQFNRGKSSDINALATRRP